MIKVHNKIAKEVILLSILDSQERIHREDPL